VTNTEIQEIRPKMPRKNNFVNVGTDSETVGPAERREVETQHSQKYYTVFPAQHNRWQGAGNPFS
jgi:hypothetical protein